MSPAPILTSPSVSGSDSSNTLLIDSPLSSPQTSQSSSAPFADASDVIPPTHPARTLVLCFDGTGDQFDADNSNVVAFFSMLKKDDRRQQMVYYQAGIGTYTSPKIATPGMAKLSKTLDEMIAWNLDAHVMSGYEFLMQNYEAGDKICIFGFSRGAYTARALAGMIHKVGLLPACNHQQVPFAYKMFTRADELGWQQSTAFKKAFSIDVDIEFIGVWDTVCSVGLIPRRLPFTTSNTVVKTFRHALALDERRAKFKAKTFNRPTEAEAQLGTHAGDMPKSAAEIVTADADHIEAIGDLKKKTSIGQDKGKAKPKSRKALEREYSSREGTSLETDVLEVWFAGCHCDVGGGSVPNTTEHALARIPLRWMIRQCFLTNTGIRFHASLLRTIGLEPTALYPAVAPRPPAVSSSPSVIPTSTTSPLGHMRGSTTGTLVNYADSPALASGSPGTVLTSEEEEDLIDALCPIYDQLSLAWFWWILEILPMKQHVQREDDSWLGEWTGYRVNMGHGRKIPKQKKQGFYVHRSVKIRMEAKDLPGGPYVPKALFKVEPTWVD